MSEPRKHLIKSAKRAPMQCSCLRCAKPMRSAVTDCPMTASLCAAVVDFAAKNGTTWKAKLGQLWLSGKDSTELRQVRNILGTYGLSKIRLENLQR